MRTLPRFLIAVLALAGFSAGCGRDGGGPTGLAETSRARPMDPEGVPARPHDPSPLSLDAYVAATTPATAVGRLFETYGEQDRAAYGQTLTSDFRYFFSPQADPDLVSQYGNTWGLADEESATSNLFDGFVDDQGVYQAGAGSIFIGLHFMQVFSDPTHSDSTDHYALVTIPQMSIEVLLEGDLAIEIVSAFNVYVVRGDAAKLRSGQWKGSARWYVRRIDDLAYPFLGSQLASLPPRSSTWGTLRSIYAAPRMARDR